VLIDLSSPNIKTLQYSFFHTIRKAVQSNNNSHFVLIFILLIDLFQLLQIDSIISYISMVFFQKTRKLAVTV